MIPDVARACLMNGVRSSDGRDPNARLLSPVPVSCTPHVDLSFLSAMHCGMWTEFLRSDLGSRSVNKQWYIMILLNKSDRFRPVNV